MKLHLNISDSISGEMIPAALISAGAGLLEMENAMYAAAAKIGYASVKAFTNDDGSVQLLIETDPLHQTISVHEANHLLAAIFEELELAPQYRDFGHQALHHLIVLEHSYSNNHLPHTSEMVLQNAQYLLITITGTAYGLQLLEAPVEATLHTSLPIDNALRDGLETNYKTATYLLQNNNNLALNNPEFWTPLAASLITAFKSVEISQQPSGRVLAEGRARGNNDSSPQSITITIYEEE